MPIFRGTFHNNCANESKPLSTNRGYQLQDLGLWAGAVRKQNDKLPWIIAEDMSTSDPGYTHTFTSARIGLLPSS